MRLAVGVVIGSLTFLAGGVAHAAAESCGGLASTIVGTWASERLVGTPGRDVIWAGGGRDEIWAAGGDDVICAGRRDDRVHAGQGDDLVLPGSGSDLVFGGGGADRIRDSMATTISAETGVTTRFMVAPAAT
jgi:Ca2+-binding RTX toxin-like protein